MMRRTVLVWIALVPLAGLAWSPPGHAREDGARPDYRPLDDVLLRNVDRGFVDYDGIAADPAFARFIEALDTTPPGPADDSAARLAFYINAYNALTVDSILDGLSPAGERGRRAFHRQRRHRVGGETLSLDALAQERLAPFGDPRVHLALACPSLSCPPLANRAFRAATLDADLDAAARRFANDPTRNRFDVSRRIAWLAAVFRDHEDDFAREAGSLQAWLAHHVDDPQAARLLASGGFTVHWFDPEPVLNGLRRQGARAGD